jgi:hypothetical protein
MSFWIREEGTFLEEEEDALHEGLRETLENLRRRLLLLRACMERISMEF